MLSRRRFYLIVFIFLVFLANNYCFSELEDEFDVSNSIIELEDLMQGGPKKDSIPAIMEPNFVYAGFDTFLNEDDLVIGVSRGLEAKAYPVKILNWHGVVNDTIADEPILITWCPLTRTAMVFKRDIKGEVLSFGVSGLVYNSNLVMFDRKYMALWSQLASTAITGLPAGKKLKDIPSMVTTWKRWKYIYPGTQVLTTYTGYKFDYYYDPYSGYHKSSGVIFILPHNDKRLPAKSLVIGIRLNSVPKAYAIDSMNDRNSPIRDKLAGVSIQIYKGPLNTAYITDSNGNLLSAHTMYWFAWSNFNQNTLLHDIAPVKRRGHVIK